VSNYLRRFIIVVVFLAGCATPGAPPTWVLDTGTINRNTVAFNADARLLASGAVNGEVTVWALPAGERVHRWKAHTASVYGLAFIGGDRIVSASFDASIALWDGDRTLLLRRITPAPITAMAVNESADLVLTAHRDGMVRRWRLSDLHPVSQVPRHRGSVRAVGYHASGWYASSGHDGAVYVWRADETPRALAKPPTDARDLVFSPDGRFLYGGGWFNVFRWRVDDGTLTVMPTAHHGIVTSLDVTRDGHRLASISRETDSSVQLLDAGTGATLVRLESHELCGAHVRLSPDGRYLASTSDDATVRVWDLAAIALPP